jgi:transcriptional regulator of arginine metabolism
LPAPQRLAAETSALLRGRDVSRRVREQAILELIDAGPISNQDALVERLRERGIPATQATVSRDIKRLGLVKAPAAGGGYRYAAPSLAPRSTQRGRRQLKSACEQFVTKIETGGSLLVLKTLTGRANAVAVALDEYRLDGIVGTLAGDDTILVIARNDRDRARIKKVFDEMVG